MNGWIGGQVDGETDGWVFRWMVGWTDGWVSLYYSVISMKPGSAVPTRVSPIENPPPSLPCIPEPRSHWQLYTISA